MPVADHPNPALPLIDDPAPHTPKPVPDSPDKPDNLFKSPSLRSPSPPPRAATPPPPPATTSHPEPKPQTTPPSSKSQPKESTPPPPAPPVQEEELTEDESPKSVIDMEIFQQILDLDEGSTREFSREMTSEYFNQVENTFEDMDEALRTRDLERLSSLGHFLKGSSAALGVAKVQASCEKMQHYGQLRDEQKGVGLTEQDALNLISKLLSQVKKEYIEAERWLMEWYAANPDPN